MREGKGEEKRGEEKEGEIRERSTGGDKDSHREGTEVDRVLLSPQYSLGPWDPLTGAPEKYVCPVLSSA
jgi:hypothetical protein